MFSLDIKVQAFMRKDNDGKKIYVKGKEVHWSMEVGTITFEMLVSSLSEVVSWSSYQKGTVWYFDKTLGEDAMIVDDNQFQNMLGMYKSEMSCKLLLIVVEKTIFEQHFVAQQHILAEDPLQPALELQPEPLVVIPPEPTSPQRIAAEPQPEPNSPPDIFVEP